MSDTDSVTTTIPGAFQASLMRNNKKIRDDRAAAISEDALMLYKRTIEDKQAELKKLRRARESMLDLSPTDAQSLVLATDFDAADFVSRDITIGLKIREVEIVLEVADKRFKELFTGEAA